MEGNPKSQKISQPQKLRTLKFVCIATVKLLYPSVYFLYDISQAQRIAISVLIVLARLICILQSLFAHMGVWTDMQTHGFGQTNFSKPRS